MTAASNLTALWPAPSPTGFPSRENAPGFPGISSPRSDWRLLVRREFAEQILADLIAEGYSGTKLLDEFKTRQAKIRPAIEALLEDAREAALGKGEYSTYDDVFGPED